MATDDELLPLAEAARRLGITYNAAYARVRQGRLRVSLVDNRYMVLTSEVERYRDEVIAQRPHGRPRGRPKKMIE